MGESYDPEIYDLVIPNTFRGDVEWYRRKARESGGPVLELGAGTGRVTIPIAEDGVAVTALDVDPGMLGVLRHKVAGLPLDVQQRLSLVESDMRSFELRERFALAIIPFRAFLHNLTWDDQLACLRQVHAHLTPGGGLAFNVFHPSLEFMGQNSGALAGVWRWTSTQPRENGGTLVRSDANRYDTVRQRVRSMLRFELFDADGNLTRTYLQRLELAYLHSGDVMRLLEQTGFQDITIAGDFTGRRLEHDTDELVVEARRP